MLKTIGFLFIFFGSISSFCQTENTVLKIHTFAEVEKLHLLNPKPVVVFITTDWCKICHAMKKTTFKNETIIRNLNTKFYFIQLNGEEKKDLHFLGKTFVYKPTGTNTGIHELANELASKKGRIAYPTTVVLNSNLEIDAQLIGFINSKKMTSLLKSMYSQISLKMP